MTPQELKNSILQLAIQGKLVEQRPEEGTAEELYQQIQAEKDALIKAGKLKREKPLPEITEDEIPFDIPNNWKWIRFGECGALKSGFAFKSTDYTDSGIQVVRISDLAENEISYKDVVFYTQKDSLSPYLITKNSFLICMTGSIGKMAWVQDDVPRYLNQRVGMFVPLTGCETSYLWWFLHNGLVLQQWVRAKTSTNGNIKNSDITDLVLPLPPLAEQKRIVSKIEDLLPLIERYKKAWTRLEDFNKRFPGDMQKSILQMAIQGKLVEQRAEEGTGEDLYQHIQTEKQVLIKAGKIKKEKPLPEIPEDEILFEIPESWKWVRFADLYVLSNGTASRGTPGGIERPVLRLADLSNDDISTKDIRTIALLDKEFKSHILQTGDLIFIRVNGSKDRVATAYHYKADENISYCDHLFCGHRTSRLIYAEYIMFIFNCPSIRKQLQPEIKTTAGQNTISQSSMSKIILPLPPLDEQKRIVSRLNELLPLCNRLK